MKYFQYIRIHLGDILTTRLFIFCALTIFSAYTFAKHDVDEECLAPLDGITNQAHHTLPELLKGVEHWKLSANDGDAKSQYCLGSIYQKISLYYSEKMKHWLQSSADQNYIPALIELGTAYAHGEYGFPRDPVSAGDHIAMAAMQGSALANLLMGIWQLNGLLPINEIEAYKNLRLAVEIAKSNNDMQILAFMEHMGQMHVIQNLKEKLSKEDIKNAEKYIKEWKPIDN